MSNRARATILLVAGEISGDQHGAELVRAVRARNPDINFFGIGGAALRAAGMETLYDISETAVLGLSEVLRKIRFFRRIFRELLDAAAERQPTTAILIDYPGFNLRLAHKLHAMGIRVIYYICPQVWAWHRGRIPRMARYIDRLLTIFPFEPALFRAVGLPADFVGHPLIKLVASEQDRAPVALPWPGEPRIALLPGSRYHEIRRILPRMWRAAGILEKRYPTAGFLLAAPSEEAAAWIRKALSGLRGGPRNSRIVVGLTRPILRQARAAMVASGTATLEAALRNCPLIVVYRVAWATYLPGRLLIRVPFLGMVNIVAGESLCPEFIQHRADPAAMAAAMAPLIDDGPARKKMLTGLTQVKNALAVEPGRTEAADIVLQELDQARHGTMP